MDADQFLYNFHGRKGFVRVDDLFFHNLMTTKCKGVTVEALIQAFKCCTIYSVMKFDFTGGAFKYSIGRVLEALKFNHYVQTLDVCFSESIHSELKKLEAVLKVNKAIGRLNLSGPENVATDFRKLIAQDTQIVTLNVYRYSNQLSSFLSFVDLIKQNTSIRVISASLAVQESQHIKALNKAIMLNPHLEKFEYDWLTEETKKHMQNNKRRRQKLERCIINRVTTVDDMNRLIAEYLRV